MVFATSPAIVPAQPPLRVVGPFSATAPAGAAPTFTLYATTAGSKIVVSIVLSNNTAVPTSPGLTFTALPASISYNSGTTITVITYIATAIGGDAVITYSVPSNINGVLYAEIIGASTIELSGARSTITGDVIGLSTAASATSLVYGVYSGIIDVGVSAPISPGVSKLIKFTSPNSNAAFILEPTGLANTCQINQSVSAAQSGLFFVSFLPTPKVNAGSGNIILRTPAASASDLLLYNPVTPDAVAGNQDIILRAPSGEVGTILLYPPGALEGNRITSIAVGTLTLTGTAPTVVQDNIILGTSGTLTLTGAAPTISQAIYHLPAVGSLTLTGAVPVLQSNTYHVPSAGVLTLTGATPTVIQNVLTYPAVGSLTLTGAAPVSDQSYTLSPTAGNLTLTGSAPQLTQNNIVLPAAGTLTLTGEAPYLAGSAIVEPGAGTLAFSGAAPEAITPKVFSGEAGVLALFGVAPTIQIASAVEERPQGGGGYPSKHPWIHRRKPEEEERLEAIEVLEPEVVEAVVEAVAQVAEKRIVQDTAADLVTAEQELRVFLQANEKQWRDSYAQLIRLEYERREQEFEDAQIAMLLFDM